MLNKKLELEVGKKKFDITEEEGKKLLKELQEYFNPQKKGISFGI